VQILGLRAAGRDFALGGHHTLSKPFLLLICYNHAYAFRMRGQGSYGMARNILLRMTAMTVCAAAGIGASPAYPQSSTPQITALYDAFGKTSIMKKDWGFSALIEYGGKRILFDTGNNADIFAHNVQAKGIDLRQLDFAVVSHRHGDHTSGLNHLLRVNPTVKIYAPQENFGVFGAALPGTFYRRNESLPADMRYFDGEPQETLRFGSPWPEANFTWITKTTEIAPGLHLILLNGTWGVDLEVKEISLAIDTPDGIVLVVGCSHSTIEKIVEAARSTLNKPVHLLLGGTHLLPAKDDQISSIAASLRDNWNVRYIAPVHCTGEPAFAVLKQSFGDRYIYAGLGTTVLLGPKVTVKAEGGQPNKMAMDEEDLRSYREAVMRGPLHPFFGGDKRLARAQQ
jgi:7,8-dihydropterin-6-yl-methyl-4-(beta-D-ribofuranosyl)aminobenzene 5'-phosphate synthase